MLYFLPPGWTLYLQHQWSEGGDHAPSRCGTRCDWLPGQYQPGGSGVHGRLYSLTQGVYYRYTTSHDAFCYSSIYTLFTIYTLSIMIHSIVSHICTCSPYTPYRSWSIQSSHIYAPVKLCLIAFSDQYLWRAGSVLTAVEEYV